MLLVARARALAGDPNRADDASRAYRSVLGDARRLLAPPELKEDPGAGATIRERAVRAANPPGETVLELVALCANDEGKYWEYRAALFENQTDVQSRGPAAFKDIATKLGLAGFDSCYASGKHNEQLQKSTDECTAAGIYGTPTFFVNGKPYVGQTAIFDVQKEVKRLLGE